MESHKGFLVFKKILGNWRLANVMVLAPPLRGSGGRYPQDNQAQLGTNCTACQPLGTCDRLGLTFQLRQELHVLKWNI